MFDQINTMAQKRGETISDTIRYLIERGLTDKIYEKNTDLIAQVVRSEVEYALKSYSAFQAHDRSELSNKLADSIFEERVVLYRRNKNQ